jgi:hypothetical protein
MAVVFWAAFLIIVAGLFLVNREAIRTNFNTVVRRLNLSENPAPEPEEPPAGAEPPFPSTDDAGAPVQFALPPVSVEPAQPSTELPPARPEPAPALPAEKPVNQPAPRPLAEKPPAPRPAETRERNIYFSQINRDGVISRSRAARKITASDSPLLDSLNALLAGPTAEEQRQGILSLIPRNTRILSAAIRGTTAYISFSEDFQYNTYGVEGYAAQLRQIVWTATEFPTVKDVQILVEGRRVDYLGEGIWIGSPISRDSL